MKFLSAFFCLSTGYFVASLMMFPYSLLTFLLLAAGGYRLISDKKRSVILRFGRLTWVREELCRHVLITGDTGSGKTTSGFQPILHQLTENVPDWGGLILGVKGDEPAFIRELAKHHGREQDVIEIQVRPPDASTKWKPPHRYNLLSDRQIPWMTHAKAIVDIAASMTDGHQHAFFRPMAQIAIANALELIDEVGAPVTITRAYDVLTSKETANYYVKKLMREGASERVKPLGEFFESTFIRAHGHEQREATEGTIKTYLGFFLNPDVAAVFSSDEPNTFSFSEIDRGGIITLGMPQSLATERRYVQTYLKFLLYLHALRRFDKPKHERKNENLLLLGS